jgi:hypothetical protein
MTAFFVIDYHILRLYSSCRNGYSFLGLFDHLHCMKIAALWDVDVTPYSLGVDRVSEVHTASIIRAMHCVHNCSYRTVTQRLRPFACRDYSAIHLINGSSFLMAFEGLLRSVQTLAILATTRAFYPRKLYL